MVAINPGDTIQVSFGPHMVPTTAQVAAVDNIKRQLTVTHLSGPLQAKTGTLHMDHARALSDTFAPHCDGKLWQ